MITQTVFDTRHRKKGELTDLQRNYSKSRLNVTQTRRWREKKICTLSDPYCRVYRKHTVDSAVFGENLWINEAVDMFRENGAHRQGLAQIITRPHDVHYCCGIYEPEIH